MNNSERKAKLNKTYNSPLKTKTFNVINSLSDRFIYYLYSYDDECLYLQLEKKYIKNLVHIYIIEFALATLCFLIGIISFCGCNSLFTKIYKAFNNLFKSIIVIISVIFLF